jgi:hypothetical protein
VIDSDLVLAGADLAKTAPESWRKFLAALEVHVKRQSLTLLHVPQDSLFVAQGVAREADYLFSMLRDCAKTGETILASRKGVSSYGSNA